MEPLAKGGDLGSRRRRAIYSGLVRRLEPKQVMEALWVWEEEFAEGSPYGISKFVHRACEVLGLGAGHRQSLEGEIIDRLHQEGGDLGPDPFPLMLSHRGHSGSALGGADRMPTSRAPASAVAESLADGAAPQFVVLRYLLDTLLQRVERSAPGSTAVLEGGLSRALRDLEMSPGALRVIAGWSRDRARRAISSGLTVEESSRLVSAVYVWSCEVLGPVATDGHLKAVLREAEALPEAAEFSPRKLL